MASYSEARSKHWTLTGSQVDTLTLTRSWDRIEILNRDPIGGDVLYFTEGGDTPAAAGDDTLVVLPQQSVTIPASTTAIKVVSAGTPDISVMGWQGG